MKKIVIQISVEVPGHTPMPDRETVQGHDAGFLVSWPRRPGGPRLKDCRQSLGFRVLGLWDLGFGVKLRA